MNVLLDTHTLLWFLNGDTRLSADGRIVIEDTLNRKFVSVASLWEVTIKLRVGKLKLHFSLPELFRRIAENGFVVLAISELDLLSLNSLPLFHRDPFDRMIISQAIEHQMKIIGKDSEFDLYPIERIW